MNSLFEENDREQPKADADLTLGIGSLLSIFFGVILICGIFFGFGYSMGRRNGHAAPAPTATTEKPPASSTATDDDQSSAATTKPQGSDSASAFPPDFTAPVPDESRTHTSASQTSSKVDRATENSATDTAKPARSQKSVDSDAQGASLTAVEPPHRAASPGKPRAGTMTPQTDATNAAPVAGHPIMVQIAAVSRQEDAEVLAGALRKRGFNPQVRGGTTDKLFHVQVGPFTDTTQAETMKQHLLADGYNAIVK